MNICEYLGLKPNQEFKINSELCKYRFSEVDRLEYYNSNLGEWRFCGNIEVLSRILHDSDLIKAVESNVDIGLSDHDTVMLNGLNKMNGSKVVKIERDVKYENEYDEHGGEEINFFFENDRRLGLSCCNIKLDFLKKCDCEKFEVKCENDGCVKVWGIRE